jgi:hypothetical protein
MNNKSHLDVWRGESISWGPFQADWFSFCSAHRVSDPNCTTCMSGAYRSRVAGAGENFIYAYAYGLWYWWVNRSGSGTRKRLEAVFPNLK